MESVDASVHVPVLFQEVMEQMRAEEGGSFLDCTVGGGGHLTGLLKASARSSVVGVDRDSAAIERVKARTLDFQDRIALHHLPFSRIAELQDHGPFDGVLADFGLSSDQLAAGRGFSFREDAPLDMRMDSASSLTADSVVNEYSPGELLQVLRRGGVRKNLKRYVGAIVEHRPISSSQMLGEIISNATPFRDRGDAHPATVVFQAVRIEVNGELREIEDFLDTVPTLVSPGGRCLCISFHSLEDEIVAKRFRRWQGEMGPAGWPGGEKLDRPSLGVHLTKKAITPSESEVGKNPRSRSARLRVFEFSAVSPSSQ